jgi:uncharacterized protein (TIGR02270 family)
MREFHLSLYLEHLEEASFLYQQRIALLRDPGFPWLRLRNFEARLEAHLDALIIGSGLAQEACAARMQDGDAGELFAIVTLCCRQRDVSKFGELLRTLDFQDLQKVRAATDALKLYMPPEWQSSCERAIVRGERRWFPVLAEICGYKRLPVGDQIAAAVQSHEQPPSLQVVQALSRLPQSRLTISALEICIEAPDDAIKAAAIRALLRQGRHNALQRFYLLAHTEDWPQMGLALGGTRAATSVLLQRVDIGNVTETTLLALGLLGDLSAVRTLCTYLEDALLADAAAGALYLITGARLFEDKFVADDLDESEMLGFELEHWKQTGQLPKRADGLPFGTMVRQISHEAAVWDGWLEQNASRFDPSLRYRHGRPYSPRCLLQSMLDESTPNRLRELANDELVVRYGCPVAFEADWPVEEQLEALRYVSNWIAVTEPDLAPGTWS